MIILGLFLSLFYYFFFNSVFLTAFGISIIILGSTSISLAFTRPYFVFGDLMEYIVRINNSLLIVLALEFIIINSLLAIFTQYNLSIYYIVGIITYFITIWFYISIHPRLGNSLTAVCAISFIVFVVVICFKIIDILMG